MELSVPTNWDDDLLDSLQGFPVGDLYGQPDDSPTGGGRPRYLQDRVGKKRVAAHLRKIRDSGWGFTALLNAPCLDNREYQSSFRRSLMDWVGWMRGAGATGVTVTVPLLAEAIKQRYPDLRVKVSVIAHVGTVPRAQAWRALGVDEIAVDFNANRDLRRLEALRGAVDCDLSLLVNDLCLLDCPFRHYHYNLVGHASQADHPTDGFVVDYCFLRCHRRKVQQPFELLRSPWIRPEDLGAYEAIGYRRFKLAGRTKSTPAILRMVRAYASRGYQGNLLDLLEGTSRDTSTVSFSALRALMDVAPSLLGKGLAALGRVPAGTPTPGPAHFATLLARLPSRAREDLLAAYVELMRMSEAVVIDNQQLDGFLEGFAARRCGEDCGSCDHCERYAARSITVDRARVDAIAERLDRVLRGVISGSSLPR